MRGKIVRALLHSGTVCKTAPLYQYDYGQILLITGLDLPTAYEVHFSNAPHGEAVTQIGGAEGVFIPDACLLSGDPVYFWLFLHAGEDDGETEYEGTIPVIRRASISDDPPTPVEQSVITEAIAALNQAVEQTGQDVIDAGAAKTAAETAQGLAEDARDVAIEAKLDAVDAEADAILAKSAAQDAQAAAELAQGKAEDAQEAAEAARDAVFGMSATATTLAPGSSATASYSNGLLTLGIPKGDKGDTGAAGHDGAPGTDGYSPSASVSKSGSTATISVTDKTGTTTVQVSDGADGQDGADGYSPSASVSKSGSTATVTITDKTGTTTATVSDGADGAPGQDGQDGFSPVATVSKSGTTATISITDANGTTTAEVSDGEVNIDDTAGDGDTDKAWSADKLAPIAGDVTALKSAVDKKAPAIWEDASGPIASFSDGADDMPLKACTVQITPVQSGSGDPSPTNIRPISGWTGANIALADASPVDGVFPISAIQAGTGDPSPANIRAFSPGLTLTLDNDSVLTVYGGYVDIKLSRLVVTHALVTMDGDTYKAESYTSSGDSHGYRLGYGGTSKPYANRNDVLVWSSHYKGSSYASRGDNNSANYRIFQNSSNGQHLRVRHDEFDTETVPLDAYNAYLAAQYSNGTPVQVLYVMKTAQTYTLSDAELSRVLTAMGISGERFPVAFPASAGTVYVGSIDLVTGVLTVTHGQIASYDGEELPGEWISDRDVYAAGTTPTTGAQVVYELAEPLTYSLDPVSIRTLASGHVNNIWADTGDISLTYPADTRLFIASQSDIVEQVSGTTPTITAEAGKRYVCGTVSTISITPPATGICDIVFTSGSTAAVLTVPNTVKWPSWFVPSALDKNTTYELSIQDGTLGAVGTWT